MSIDVDQYIKEGMEHKKRGDYDSAEECFKKVLELDPDNSRARDELEDVRREKEDEDELLDSWVF